MTTTIRPELSERNKYWIEKHRYYELKRFCLQYPMWKKALSYILAIHSRSINLPAQKSQTSLTEQHAIERLYFTNRIEMVEKAAAATDKDLGSYILQAVTEGCSYDVLKLRYDIPCCKDSYYELYRRFFWLLDKERQ